MDRALCKELAELQLRALYVTVDVSLALSSLLDHHTHRY